MKFVNNQHHFSCVPSKCFNAVSEKQSVVIMIIQTRRKLNTMCDQETSNQLDVFSISVPKVHFHIVLHFYLILIYLTTL